jgi:uncharacterized protein (DUF2267 family)
MSNHDHIDAIDTTVQKTYRWLHEIGAEAGGADRRRSYQMLRGVLHALRDRLPVDEVAQLGAQLPMLIRGVYYEGWDPSHKPLKMSAAEFLEHIAAEAMLEEADHAVHATRAVVRVLHREIAAGEVDQVLDSLPKDIHRLIAEEHRHAV